MILSVEVPDVIARQLRLDGPQCGRRALEMLALEGYREGHLSRGQVSELLTIGFDETEAFLHDNSASLGITAEDYQRSSAALKQLLAK